ncbi:MAG: NAD(P)/FAD-dependent oxidoreductase [Myxococcales bacterium]|nr:NAD(P)/FAD-dependent oxidoreductase [Myxococcales bacterium]
MGDTEKQTIRATIAIIGAGPAGTAAAIHLGQLGVRDVVLLDAHDFPRDKTCGSGLSPRAIEVLRGLEVWGRVADRAYRIRGLRLVTPGGREAYLPASDEMDVAVCLRRDLDYTMLQRALELDVRFVANFRAHTPLVENGRWVGMRARDGREVRAEHLVIANGAHSKFIINDEPTHEINTIMGWWRGVPFQDGYLEMLFDQMVHPLYGWLFPESAERVNIGITYHDPEKRLKARDLFQRFLDKHYAARIANATPIGKWQGHPIRFAYTLGPLWSPGRVIIGEAGRMTHPATGEGIYQGMQSGIFAAEALDAVLHRRVSEAAAFSRYENRCRLRFLPSFYAGWAFRQLLRTPALDWAAALAANPAVQRGLSLGLSSI